LCAGEIGMVFWMKVRNDEEEAIHFSSGLMMAASGIAYSVDAAGTGGGFGERMRRLI